MDAEVPRPFLAPPRRELCYHLRLASFARRPRWYWRLVRDQYQCRGDKIDAILSPRDPPPHVVAT
jgi:hypothetical protein